MNEKPVVPSLWGLLWRLLPVAVLIFCIWVMRSQNQLIIKQNAVILRQNEALKLCVGEK